MDLHLSDKHILITGGSKGIGLACAQALRAAGAEVVVSARKPQGVQDWAAQDAGVVARVVDVNTRWQGAAFVLYIFLHIG